MKSKLSKSISHTALAATIVLMVAVGCGGDDGEATAVPAAATAAPTTQSRTPTVPADTPTPSATGPGATTFPPDTPGVPASENETVLGETETAARKLLVDELDVDEGDLTLDSSEGVGWSDTSLGCPQEGHAYAQVITPGYKLVFLLTGTSLPGAYQLRRLPHGDLPRRAVALSKEEMPIPESTLVRSSHHQAGTAFKLGHVPRTGGTISGSTGRGCAVTLPVGLTRGHLQGDGGDPRGPHLGRGRWAGHLPVGLREGGAGGPGLRTGGRGLRCQALLVHGIGGQNRGDAAPQGGGRAPGALRAGRVLTYNEHLLERIWKKPPAPT